MMDERRIRKIIHGELAAALNESAFYGPDFNSLVRLLSEYRLKYPKNPDWKKFIRAHRKDIDLAPISHLFEYVNFLERVKENPSIISYKKFGDKITGFGEDGYLRYNKPDFHIKCITTLMWLYAFYQTHRELVAKSKRSELFDSAIAEIVGLPRLQGEDDEKVKTLHVAMGTIKEGMSPSRNMALLFHIYFETTKFW